MRIAVGHDDADGRFLEHVGRHAANDDIPRVDELRRAVRGRVLVGVLRDCERPDVPAARASAELAAILDVEGLARWAQAEPAREKGQAILARRARHGRIHRAAAATAAATATATTATAAVGANAPELEDVGVLEEEVALLGKEEAESREVHLAVVDLGGRKIRVDCESAVQ